MLWNKQKKWKLTNLLTVVIVGLVCASSAVGATLNVPSAAYPTIQSAIDAAVNGDTVQVAAGTYAENLWWEDKSIALIGAGADLTIVDGGTWRSCLIMINVPDTASVEGFTFTNSGHEGPRFMIAEAKAGGMGGGLWLVGSSPTISNNIITGNESLDFGGAVLLDYSSPTLIGNTVSGNTAGEDGGGLYLYFSDAELFNNTISGNSAGKDGGGLYLFNSDAELFNNAISGNSATNGGGMYFYNSCYLLMNNTITSNTGGGIYVPPEMMEDCLTILLIHNCILWGNGDYDLDAGAASLPTNYSDIGILVGSIIGVGNISADPMFVNPSAGDYHLRADSPCIDAGNWAWALPETDFDGNPRIVDGDGDGTPTVDMGAFETIAGSTPPGTDVIVQPVDPVTGDTPVTLIFDDVNQGGVTTVTSTTPSGQQGAPQGFKFGNPAVMYEISTTADYTGNITVCFDYSGASYGNEANLKLFHRTNGGWMDITNPDDPPDNPNPDTINKIICGTVTSLSFFGVFESEFVDPVELLGELAGKVFGLNLQQGISNSLDAKLDAALKAIDDVNANNDVAAINTLEAFINHVQAQSGDKISVADADDLIYAANNIIVALQNGCY